VAWKFGKYRMLFESLIRWHIGCSGVYYKEWKDLFYPKGLPPSKWFDYYAQQFNTLELNVTFYRFPQASLLQNWYRKSPAGFSFAVKAPRQITHQRLFNNTGELLKDFYRTIREGLREKLQGVLFQFHSSVAYSEAFLMRVLDQLDVSLLNILEFRHESWWNQQVYDMLAAKGVVFCSISHPQLPDKVIVNRDVVYYRFHGVPELYYSPYAPGFLHKVIDAIKMAGAVKEALLYFNNTAQGAAVMNARYAQQLV